jgi:hypothetical protein
MQHLREARQPKPPKGARGQTPTHKQVFLWAGVSSSSYKRLMRDPDYWRCMEVQALEDLLKRLGFDLMVCVGSASTLKVPLRA